MTEINNIEEPSQINRLPMVIRGFFLVALGVSLFSLSPDKLSTSLLFLFAILAGLTGIVFVLVNKVGSILKTWIIIESIGDFLLGTSFMYLLLNDKNTLSHLRDVFSAFAILFAFMQFTYLYLVTLTGFNENIKILVLRGLTAIGYGLFGVVLFMQSDGNQLIFWLNFIGTGPLIAGIGCVFLSMHSFRKQSIQGSIY